MTLYGIRQIHNGTARPLCVLAQAELGGETDDGLRSKRYLEITAGIALTTHRKTLFISEDLSFVVELFLAGTAWDYEEYFEFSRSQPNTTYEVYNAVTGEKVEVDINDPAFAEVKKSIEFRLEQEKKHRQGGEAWQEEQTL